MRNLGCQTVFVLALASSVWQLWKQSVKPCCSDCGVKVGLLHVQRRSCFESNICQCCWCETCLEVYDYYYYNCFWIMYRLRRTNRRPNRIITVEVFSWICYNVSIFYLHPWLELWGLSARMESLYLICIYSINLLWQCKMHCKCFKSDLFYLGDFFNKLTKTF